MFFLAIVLTLAFAMFSVLKTIYFMHKLKHYDEIRNFEYFWIKYGIFFGAVFPMIVVYLYLEFLFSFMIMNQDLEHEARKGRGAFPENPPEKRAFLAQSQIEA